MDNSLGVILVRRAECGVRSKPCSAFRIPHSALNKGQASLEMTVALFGGLLLLLGSFKIFLWSSERIIRRQQYYDCTRSAAGGATPGVWSDPASQIPLRIFEDRPISPNPC